MVASRSGSGGPRFLGIGRSWVCCRGFLRATTLLCSASPARGSVRFFVLWASGGGHGACIYPWILAWCMRWNAPCPCGEHRIHWLFLLHDRAPTATWTTIPCHQESATAPMHQPVLRLGVCTGCVRGSPVSLHGAQMQAEKRWSVRRLIDPQQTACGMGTKENVPQAP